MTSLAFAKPSSTRVAAASTDEQPWSHMTMTGLSTSGAVRVAPCAVGGKAPFEHRARDVQRARDDAVVLTVQVGTDVAQRGAVSNGGRGFLGSQPRDRSRGRPQQLLERTSLWGDRHGFDDLPRGAQ